MPVPFLTLIMRLRSLSLEEATMQQEFLCTARMDGRETCRPYRITESGMPAPASSMIILR